MVQKINSKRVAIVPLEPNATNYLSKWALIDSFETKFLKITAFFSYSNEASFQESTDVNTELRSTLYTYDITTVPIRCEDVPFACCFDSSIQIVVFTRSGGGGRV